MIASEYVAAGAHVYIAGRAAKDLEKTAEELNRIGKGRCAWIAADLSTEAGVDHVVAELTKKEKHLNILVNNAGANWGAPIESYPDSAFAKVLTLNLQRVFTLTQRLVPLMLASLPPTKNGDGPWDNPARIINIGSVDGIRVPSLETYAYSASKAGLHQLSRVFAGQLGPKGITSNTLACGTYLLLSERSLPSAGRNLSLTPLFSRSVRNEDDGRYSCRRPRHDHRRRSPRSYRYSSRRR